MKLDTIVKFNKELKLIINKSDSFESVGWVDHNYECMLSFCESQDYLSIALTRDNIAALFVKAEDIKNVDSEISFILSNNPKKDFYLFHNYLAKETNFYGKNVPTKISSTANIHETAFICEKNVKIGKNVIIEPKVTVLENSIIEDNVIIRAGSVIGCEGVEYKRFRDTMVSVIHAGGVWIKRNTVIGSNCCINKSVFDDFTVIDEGVIIGNLVSVGHNCIIGKRTLLLTHVMIGGSTIIDEDVWVGPGALIADRKKIGKEAFVTMGSVVTKDVSAGVKVSGNFAISHEKFIKHIKDLSKL